MASTAGNTRQSRSASSLKSDTKLVKLPIVTSAASASIDNSVSSSNSGGKTTARREVLIRQPSYCKILDDLKGTEAKVANMKQEGADTSIEVNESDESRDALTSGQQQVQTITINGQQYQIVSPIGVDGVQTIVAASGSPSASSINSSVVQYAASTQNGQTVFIPGTVATASTPTPQIISVATSASSPQGSTSGGAGSSIEEATRKREIRLLKNREAARECRNKKKEYIKCLENRVAILENQNKALIEELKSLKELYTGQKS